MFTSHSKHYQNILTKRLIRYNSFQRRLKPFDVDCDVTIKRFMLKKNSDKREGDTKEKARINLLWCNATMQASSSTGRFKVLYIDGEEMRTTSVMHVAGYDGSECYVINKTCNVVRKSNITAQYAGQTFHEYLHTYDSRQEPFASIWYDGTQTYGGNKYIKPCEDIERILKTCVDSGSVLAITFSSRDAKGKTAGQNIGAMKRSIKKAGFGYDVLENISYPGTMRFFMVRLK